jgi:hypothetical protein
LTNFSNGKQTQESLESDFPETTFWKTNAAKRENTFLETKPNFSFDWKMFFVDRKVFPLTRKCFSLIEKCFPLTNFSNGKQTQESLESGFPKTTFRETNMALVKLLFSFGKKTCLTLSQGRMVFSMGFICYYCLSKFICVLNK